MSISTILAKKLHITEPQLELLCLNAPKKYKVYSIPKRSMGRRVIAQPTKKLKEVQRAALDYLSPYLDVHFSAYAYRKGVGIKNNANEHKSNSYLLKMDFQNFFNKIKPDLFFRKLKQKIPELNYRDEELLRNIFFWKPGLKRSKTLVLSVGAPSSPHISNFVMFEFDSKMEFLCASMGVKYTRYADDLTFSTNKKELLFQIPKIVRGLLSNYMTSLSINDSKTVYSSRAHNRHVTGVTITNSGTLSLGRKKKKHISSLIFKFSNNSIEHEDLSLLRGMLGHAKYIEPDFVNRMIVKYGSEIINNIVTGGNHE